MSEIVFPFADAEVADLEDAGTMNIEIKNTLTILKKSGGFGQAVTGLSLTANKDLRIGSRVKIDIAQGATGRNVAFGSAGSTIVAPALTGVANDRDTIELVWDGTAFVGGAWAKVVDAA